MRKICGLARCFNLCRCSRLQESYNERTKFDSVLSSTNISAALPTSISSHFVLCRNKIIFLLIVTIRAGMRDKCRVKVRFRWQDKAFAFNCSKYFVQQHTGFDSTSIGSLESANLVLEM